MAAPLIIFDWNGTLYSKALSAGFPYAAHVLQGLRERGYTLALISKSENVGERRKQIEDTGLHTHFQSVTISPDKSNQQFLNVIAQHAATPASTSIVDDYVIRGIQIGNEIGAKTFWVKDGGEFPEVLPDEKTGQPTHTIATAEALLDLLP